MGPVAQSSVEARELWNRRAPDPALTAALAEVQRLREENAKLDEAGVRNLKEFGYPDVNAHNILTDRIYSEFFRSMLHENLGHDFDADIKALIKELPSQNSEEGQVRG